MSALAELHNMGLSVRLAGVNGLTLDGLKDLMPGQRDQALTLARQHKDSILEELHKRSLPPSNDPTPDQLAHARRMLVDCPDTGGKRHCWHCSRCPASSSCMAWRVRRSDVIFFRQSEKPFSLFLVESLEAPGVVQ
jgi:hypothetical protein